jgi:hypothetical protein
LSGRDGFSAFVEVKCLFSTTPKAEIFSKSSWIETKANGDHWGDRTWSRYDQTCPVSGSNSQARVARVLHRCVRSLTGLARPVRRLEEQQNVRVDRTRWCVRSVTIGRVRSQKTLPGPFLYLDRTPRVTRPVSSTARPVG